MKPFEYNDVWRRICAATGWSKQKELASFLGITQPSVSGAKKRGVFPVEWAQVVAEKYNLDINWLLTGTGSMRGDSQNLLESQDRAGGKNTQGRTPASQPLPKEERADREYSGSELQQLGFTLVPRYDIQVSLGPGALVDTEQIVDYLAFKTAWLKTEMRLEPGKLALLSAVGDSMHPTIREKDLLLIDLRRREVTEDAIYVIRRHSTLAAKRFQRFHDGTIKIKSDNPIYEEETVPPTDARTLNLIGRVVWIGRRA